MPAPGQAGSIEEQIDQWRRYLGRRQAIHATDVSELEDHLREQVADLVDAGLAPDEAFLVAVKRLGALDALSREFALEHADRLWKQLVLTPSATGDVRSPARTDAIAAFCFTAAAAVAIKAPASFGLGMDEDAGFYLRNLGLLVLPLLTGYFAWKRRLGPATLCWLAVAFAAAAIVANAYPFVPGGSTEALTGLHLPIALWLAVGIAYAGGRWNQVGGRMDFIRFSGELVIYCVLIALGGGLLAGFMALTFQSIGIDIEPFFESWLLPCGAMATVVIAAWTRLFTPVFAIMLVTFLATMLWIGRGIAIEREALIAFDLLLVVVLALLLYSVSARDPRSPPDAFDAMQVVLVVSALLADAVALWAIAGRITEFGFSPNRAAALGVNVILLVNLAWSAVLYLRFLGRRGSFTDLERWQTDYLPVYAGWAVIVVILFPPAFGFI